MPTGESVSAVDLSGLLSRRLVFVTGKGGTGKSTITAAIARAAADAGLRTLACEMDAKGDLASALGIKRPGFTPVAVEPKLHAMTMDTESSLREYMKVHLRVPLLAKIGPLASTFDFVADAAPGVKEVLAIGKVCWEVRENHFDIVVVDGEASGHIVSQIASPRVIRSLVPRGPLREQTTWMLEILDDPLRCSAVIVANPEDMVVTESIDLLGSLRADTQTHVAAVVLNRCESSPIDDDLVPVFERLRRFARDEPQLLGGGRFTAMASVEALIERHRESDQQRHRLIEGVSPIPVIDVPTFDESAGDDVVAEVARVLTGASL